jgi:RNA polymerase sigma-70 factor (ECF subfamily)
MVFMMPHADSAPSAAATTAIGGSPCLLDEAFRSKRDLLTHIATRITRNTADAEDVVQLAFLRACEHGVRLPPERLMYWLKTVVRRLSIDQLRRAATQLRYVELRHQGEHIDAWRGLCSTLPTIEELDMLVKTLPSATQKTFRLWCAGASYESIALVQRIPVGTVATRILRARARLLSIVRDGGNGQ